MTPDDAEQIHQTRRELAELARTNNWQPTLPHSGWHAGDKYHWVWLRLFRPEDGARIDIEWCDDHKITPGGCTMYVVIDARTVVLHPPSRRMIEQAITKSAGALRAAHDLARHLAAYEDAIDLRDEGPTP